MGHDNVSLKMSLAGSLQAGLPLTERPYLALASELGCDEATVLALTEELTKEGYVRSFGAFADFERLGYEGILCGLAVPWEKVGRVASLLNGRREVTHNYLRRHSVNMWFTALLKADSRGLFIEQALRALGHPFVVLATEARLKLSPAFGFLPGAPIWGKGPPKPLSSNGLENGMEDGMETGAPIPEANGEALEVLALLQNDFPIVPEPFSLAASKLKRSVPQLLEILRKLQKTRALRRIGASLHHRRMGYNANALAAWAMAKGAKNAEDRAGSAAEKIFHLPEVSHIYVRRSIENTLPFDWPYSLYTMLHAPDAPALGELLRSVEKAIGPKDFVVLPTVRELKKTRYRLDPAAREQGAAPDVCA
jgi:DNA-binding Lrp family transcriptional regulator